MFIIAKNWNQPKCPTREWKIIFGLFITHVYIKFHLNNIKRHTKLKSILFKITYLYGIFQKKLNIYIKFSKTVSTWTGESDEHTDGFKS